VQVIKLISRVIADFANGEISQAGSLFDTEVTLEQYLDKSFYKTASLIAASCRSSAVFSKMDEDHKDAMYAYGKHLGLAFQVTLGFLHVYALFHCARALSGWAMPLCGLGGHATVIVQDMSTCNLHLLIAGLRWIRWWQWLPRAVQ
jgi:hypothetical protein